MGFIISVSWNGCGYILIITDGYSICYWIKTLYENQESSPAFREFITFIKNQTSQKLNN